MGKRMAGAGAAHVAFQVLSVLVLVAILAARFSVIPIWVVAVLFAALLVSFVLARTPRGSRRG